jgi:hypothetical protein
MENTTNKQGKHVRSSDVRRSPASQRTRRQAAKQAAEPFAAHLPPVLPAERLWLSSAAVPARIAARPKRTQSCGAGGRV